MIERSRITKEVLVPVLYLDLDGTVREGKDDALGKFVNGPKDVRVFPEAAVQMQRWRSQRGGRIVAVSNQGGVALGLVSFGMVQAAMLETSKQTGNLFDKMCYCIHHPQADTPEMARCWCRKPSPGLIIEGALALSSQFPGEIYPPHLGLMVGDRDEDQECARIASLDFMWANQWRKEA